jgi:hypothetical protein
MRQEIMTDLYIYNNKIESIFQLLGEKENGISYSVGYALSHCEKFLKLFLERLNIKHFKAGKIQIRLQQHEKEKGFTDFEIIHENEFHIRIEAKKGWIYPEDEQLSKYAKREWLAQVRKIVVLNESTPAFTEANFRKTSIETVPIEVISWNEIRNIALSSKMVGRNTENQLLEQLSIYLNKINSMQNVDSNRVYVVSLGKDKVVPDSDITWRDIVLNDKKYYHPVGGSKGGWPVEPPNYIAFRYDGKLQSIHHIEKYEVMNDLSKHFEIPKDTETRYLYHLGPAIKLAHEVRTGEGIRRCQRVWAALDLLLTSQTIEEARDKTKERESRINK